MATERNPFEQIPQEVSNVIPIAPEEETDMNATFQVEEDGGVTVNFEDEEVLMEPSEEIAEWYGDLSETLEEDEYTELSKELFDKAAEYWIQALKLAPDNYPGARNWLKVTGRLRETN